MHTKEPQGTSITFRIHQTLYDRLKDLAEYHGRSISDEARRALEIHHVEAMLAYLQTPEGKAEMGDRLPDARRQVKSDLAELIKETYRRPPMPEPPFGSALN